MGKRACSICVPLSCPWRSELASRSMVSKRRIARRGQKVDIPLRRTSSLVPWLCFLPRATFACSCAAVFLAHNVSRGICGACALRCLSPQGPFSWDSHKYSPRHYAKQTYFLSLLSCLCY